MPYAAWCEDPACEFAVAYIETINKHTHPHVVSSSRPAKRETQIRWSSVPSVAIKVQVPLFDLDYCSMGTSSFLLLVNHTPTCLFFRHYDVIAAPSEGWTSDPFTMSGRNGYLYGRGVTDNKGPIIAVAFAAAELLYRRALGVDVVFLVEGQEECGSGGFSDAVERYKEQIGHIDAILVR